MLYKFFYKRIIGSSFNSRFYKKLDLVRKYFFKGFFSKFKDVFLRFLLYGFYNPLGAAGNASFFDLAGDSSSAKPMVIKNKLFFKIKFLYRNLRCNFISLRSLTRRLALLKEPREQKTLAAKIEHLEESIRASYKKFCFQSILLLGARSFFSRIFRFTLAGFNAKSLFFPGLFKDFVINFLAFPLGVSFSPKIFIAYDFLYFNNSFSNSVSSAYPSILVPLQQSRFKAHFFWNLNL